MTASMLVLSGLALFYFAIPSLTNVIVSSSGISLQATNSFLGQRINLTTIVLRGWANRLRLHDLRYGFLFRLCVRYVLPNTK